MKTEAMKNELLKLYKGSPNWSVRVCSMSEKQITAVYLRLKQKGIIP